MLKNIFLTSLSFEKRKKFWLLVIAVGLIAVHLNLIFKYGNSNLQSISVIFLTAILFNLWKKRDRLRVNSDIFSNFIGIVIISFVLFRSSYISSFDFFVQISPILSALGLGLLASGVKGLKQYLQELFLLLAFAIPFEVVIPQIIDLATLTAKGASAILWCVGFEVSRQGVDIILPTGAVEVSPACTGIRVITRMLRLTILFLVMFPRPWIQNVLLPILAVCIAFIGNAFRVAVLAVLVAYSKHNLFEFFHGPGGHLFSITSIVIFASLCYFIVTQTVDKRAKC